MNYKRIAAGLLAVLCLAGCGKKQPVMEDGVVLDPSQDTEAPEPETDPDRQRAAAIAEGLTAKEKIEQLLVFSIYTYNGAPFLEMNPEVEAMFADHQYGGIILFDENMADIGQTAALNYDLQAAAVQNSGIPLLIAADQEGGYLLRGTGVTDTPGNMALGASGQPRLAASAASILATELAAMGFNTDFAPDADVNSEPANPIIGIRSFSDDPLAAASFASAFADSLMENGIAACGKHYPGHGNVATDSHTGLPVSDLTIEELHNNDLIPFASLAGGHADMIMTAHICYPNVETETYISKLDGSEITLPATLSQTLVQDILRGELGFDGVVTTDSMMMGALRDHFDPIDAAVLALNAGVDLLLMPMDVCDAAAQANLDQYAETLAGLVGDRISEERLNEAVTRVLTMKARRGILDWTAGDKAALVSNAETFVGSGANLESERAIADQCVTVVKNDSVLPLTGSGRVLLAGIQESQRASLEEGFRRLAGETEYTADFINLSYGRNMPGSVSGYDAVIVTSWLNNMSQFDPAESVMIPQIRALIQQAHAEGIPCIVISTELPYDLSCYDSADALLAVYNPIGLRYSESGAVTGAVGPNIPAALDIIFGHCGPSASLPVNIPGVQGTGFTDEIVYPRGTGLTW